jgi:hypothetical protein
MAALNGVQRGIDVSREGEYKAKIWVRRLQFG